MKNLLSTIFYILMLPSLIIGAVLFVIVDLVIGGEEE